MVLLLPIVGPPLPTLSDPFISVTVLAPTIGSSAIAVIPAGGAVAASGSYSADLFALNGIFAASSCAPAALAARSSPDEIDVLGRGGPLTVARLLRLSPTDFGAMGGGRLNLAMNEGTFGDD